MKKIALSFISLLFLNNSAHAELTLVKVIHASPILAKMLPTTNTHPFSGDNTVEVDKSTYDIRFFMFEDKDHPDRTFKESIEASNQRNLKFKESRNRPGVYYVSTYVQDPKERETIKVHYTLSIEPKGQIKHIPSLGVILDHAPQVAEFKSTSLAWPAKKDSIITIEGKKYQIRYYYYNQKDNAHENFDDFIRANNLESEKPKLQDNGYAKLVVFSASQELKDKGVEYVVSLGEVKE